MVCRKNQDPKELRDLLQYEEDTGKLFWKIRPDWMFEHVRTARRWNGRFAGKEAFTALAGTGYRYGSIHKKMYGATRVIWAVKTGEWPKGEVDHINGDILDNRWENLRIATHSQNGKNRGAPSNNTSGYKGVSFHRKNGKWRAAIHSEGKKYHLGYFNSAELASQAYEEAAKIHHGNFARIS